MPDTGDRPLGARENTTTNHESMNRKSNGREVVLPGTGLLCDQKVNMKLGLNSVESRFIETKTTIKKSQVVGSRCMSCNDRDLREPGSSRHVTVGLRRVICTYRVYLEGTYVDRATFDGSNPPRSFLSYRPRPQSLKMYRAKG